MAVAGESGSLVAGGGALLYCSCPTTLLPFLPVPMTTESETECVLRDKYMQQKICIRLWLSALVGAAADLTTNYLLDNK